jgi:4-amino-4-deoxy-L-arabinose transferase-like glycosyltransferase
MMRLPLGKGKRGAFVYLGPALLLWIGLGFLLINDFGMSWDEATRWKSGDVKLDYYHGLLSAENKLAYASSAGTEPYPGLFDMSLGIAHRLTGWDRFQLGHFWSFGFATLALISTALAAYALAGPAAAALAALLLALSPTFFSHAFFNPKDIPFAATYMLATWGLLLLANRLPDARLRTFLICGVFIGLAMAVRIAGMVLLAYVLAICVLAVVAQPRPSATNFPSYLKLAKPFVIGLPLLGLAALLTLLPWWPSAHKNPFATSTSTLQHLHSSASEIPLLFAGRMMDAADAPHWYTVWMLLIKLPFSHLLLAAVALAAAAIYLRQTTCLKLMQHSQWFAICLSAFFPIIYLSITAPALHNADRHFLFIYPPLFVLIAAGAVAAWSRIRLMSKPAALAALTIGCLALAGTAINIARLHPYSYVFYNGLIGGTDSAYGRYETEYWFTSTKHAIERLDAFLRQHPDHIPDNGIVRLFISGPHAVASPFLPEGFYLTSDPNAADFRILNSQMAMDSLASTPAILSIQRKGLPIVSVFTASEPF